MQTAQVLVAVDNPIGEGVLAAAVNRVLGREVNAVDWEVIIKQIEYVGAVTIDMDMDDVA